jgi:proline iminopeptidase
VQQAAAQEWCRYEACCSSLVPNPDLLALVQRPEVSIPMARIEAHYLANGFFLEPDGLLSAVEQLRKTPCTVIHGRHDLICPLGLSVEPLARRWPEAEVIIVPDAGHSAAEPPLRAAIVRSIEQQANDRWAEKT